MKKFIQCVFISLFSLWANYAYADSKTIMITEGSLPYTNQTWFYNSNDNEVKKAIGDNWDLGKRITSAAYTDKGLLVTMAHNTSISMQYYIFLDSWPSDWIAEKYREGNNYITAMTYSGSVWFVVMSQDSRFSDQAWRRDSWPNLAQWIKENWDKGFRITEAAHDGSNWTVVMSKTNFINGQAYSFPSDLTAEINRIWNEGYRVQLLNHGGGQFFLVTCTYFQDNGRSQGWCSQVDNVQQFVSDKWAIPEKIAYIGGGDNKRSSNVNYYNGGFQPGVPVEHYNGLPSSGSPSKQPAQQHRACPRCGGNGMCPRCHGKGWYLNEGRSYDCVTCHRSGKCPVCHGLGYVR